jgi:hypothetical protein
VGNTHLKSCAIKKKTFSFTVMYSEVSGHNLPIPADQLSVLQGIITAHDADACYVPMWFDVGTKGTGNANPVFEPATVTLPTATF